MGRRYGWRGWVDFAGVEVLVGAGEHVDVVVVEVVGHWEGWWQQGRNPGILSPSAQNDRVRSRGGLQNELLMARRGGRRSWRRPAGGRWRLDFTYEL